MPSSFRRLPRCLLACLVSSRFPICLVPLLCSSGGTGWRLASALFAFIVVMRVSCVCHMAAGSSVRLLPVRPSPRCSTRMAGRGTAVRLSLLASFGFLPSAALVSVRGWRAGLVCLLVPMSSAGFSPAMCGFCGSRHCGCHGCFAVIYLSRVVGGGRAR